MMYFRAVRYASAVALLITVLSAPLSTAQAEPTNDFRFSLSGAYLYGPIRGNIQVPLGGEPGTTSSHRPTLSELGIDHASIWDVNGESDWRRERFYLGAQFIQPSGSDTLDEMLISHGVTFPAGSHVSSDVGLNWYRVGYGHEFDIGEGRTLRITPKIGAAILDFDYKLDSGGLSAKRSYIKAGPQFGAEVEWQPGKLPFSLDLDLMLSDNFGTSLAAISSESLLVKYRFFEHGSLSTSAMIGVAFEQIRYEDDQTVSNRVHVDLGPLFVVGLQVKF
jgi:hypothetical protein